MVAKYPERRHDPSESEIGLIGARRNRNEASDRCAGASQGREAVGASRDILDSRGSHLMRMLTTFGERGKTNIFVLAVSIFAAFAAGSAYAQAPAPAPR